MGKTPFISRKGHALCMLTDKTTSSTVVWQIMVNCSEATAFFSQVLWAYCFIFFGGVGCCLFGNGETRSGSHTWLGALGCIDYHSGHLSCSPFKAVEVNFFFFHHPVFISRRAASWHLHSWTMAVYSCHGQLITDTSPLLSAQSMAILQPALSVFPSVVITWPPCHFTSL